MSDVTCAIKNRSNEEMAERREYGIPWRKGWKSSGGLTGKHEVNTEYSDFCNFVIFSEDRQKELFIRHIVNGSDRNYVEFLQDYFYRKYKGYVTPYIEMPLDDPKRFELYNQTALDSGHPEEMIDRKGNKLRMVNEEKPSKTEPKYIEQKSESPAEEKPSGTVDVLDNNGTVIAENVGSAKDSATEQQPAPKKPENESKVEADKSTKAEGVKVPEADEMKDSQQHMSQNAVKFDPGKLGSKSSNRSDNPERKDDYKSHNGQYLKQYPELAKFIAICGDDRVVKFDNFHGLVLATVFHKRVPETADSPMKWVIDPGKIRNGFSVLTENPDRFEKDLNPLLTVGIGFDEPYIKQYLFDELDQAQVADACNKSNVNSGFYRYIAYNAFENNEIALAAANLYMFTTRLRQLGVNIRFKVVGKRSVDDFDLMIGKGVGLAYFTDNVKYEGLKVNVFKKDGYVYYSVSGDHAEEFTSLVNSLGYIVYCKAMNAAISSVQKAAEEVAKQAEVKVNAPKIDPANGKDKKNKTVELPNGR